MDPSALPRSPDPRDAGASPARRTLSAFVLVAVALSVALMSLAMALYPGGTWLDRGHPGHDFFRNFLCDLTAARALNGVANPLGSIAAAAAMLVIALGIGCFWSILPALFRPADARLGRAVRTLGLISVAGMISIPLMPSSRVGNLHAVAILAAGAPGLTALVLGVLGLARAGRTQRSARVLAALGALVLAVSAVDGALYSLHVARGGEVTLILPLLQRIATLLVLAWLTLVAARVRLPPATQQR